MLSDLPIEFHVENIFFTLKSLNLGFYIATSFDNTTVIIGLKK